MARTVKTPDVPETSKKNYTTPALFVLTVLLFCALGVAGYFYYQYRHVGNSVSSEGEEITTLTEEIGAVMELPSGETPTLATVTDREKLADQPFFQKAQNGDKVLIYTNNGRAILYRPALKSGERGKIVDVTMINVSTPAVPSETTPTPEVVIPPAEVPVVMATPKIALYNGTTKRGLTQKQEEIILKGFGEVTVIEKETAKNTDYKKTIVVDVSGKYPDLVKGLAKKYKAEITPLPEGERETTADILILFGEDQW